MMTVPAGRKRGEEETGAKRSAGIGWFRSKKFRVEGAPSPLFAVLSPVRREEEMGNREEERMGRDSEGEKRWVKMPEIRNKEQGSSLLSGSGPGGKGAER